MPLFDLVAALFALSAPSPDALPPHALYVVDTAQSEADCMRAVLRGAIPGDALAAVPQLAAALPAWGRGRPAQPLRLVLYCAPSSR